MEDEETKVTITLQQMEVEAQSAPGINDNPTIKCSQDPDEETGHDSQQLKLLGGDSLKGEGKEIEVCITKPENGSEGSTWKSRLINWEPEGNVTSIILWISIPILVWIVAFLLLGPSALPKGVVFSSLLLQVGGLLAGLVLSCVKLPELLGMLIVGIVIRNVPQLNNEIVVPTDVSSIIRQIALVVILIRAGLGLDAEALLRLKGVVIRLAFLPCLAEAFVVAIATRYILDFPWAWGFLLGFVLAAVSPAVVVPCLLSLKERGYGEDKGISTVVIAASSVDDILAISFFGVTLGFALSSADVSVFQSLIQGPIEVVLGCTYGVFFGVFMGKFLAGQEEKWRFAVMIRTVFPVAVGVISVFGSQYINYPGAGALACLTSAFVAACMWRKKGVLQDNDALSWNYSLLWFLFQPLLFGLIGREIDLSKLDSRILVLGLLCVLIALTARLIVSYYAVSRAGLNTKEKMFVAISWIPKATVQAAIGPVAYDTARSLTSSLRAEHLGLEVLTIAVLVILITAPVGAILVTLLGPKLLHKKNN